MRASQHACLTAFLIAAATAAAQPLTTAFTYQGELKNGANPAAGPFDMRFMLFDAPAGGTQVGSTVCLDNLAVAEGRFNAALDFGPQFAGSQRFLEIWVRADTGADCANTSGFTLLSPRQPLTATPSALFALNAAAANTAANSAQLNGQPPAFYTNASNLTSGSLNSALLPTPFNLTGNVAGGTQQLLRVQNTNAGFGVGIATTATGVGIKATSTATTGQTIGGQFESNSDGGTALIATANNGEYGVRGISTSPNGVGVSGEATSPSGNTVGMIGGAQSPDGVGVIGSAGRRGVIGQAISPGSIGVEGFAPGDGFAGFFHGRGHFAGNVGIGTTSPLTSLHVVGNWDTENGAMRIDGDKPTLRFTGGAASGNQSWMFHVGADGPGNLGVFRRIAPTAWVPIMAITPQGTLGIGVTSTNFRPIWARGAEIPTARFESTHGIAAAAEFSSTASGAVWELGVAGSTPPFPGMPVPFAMFPGSMYLYKHGQPRPWLAIDPGGTVRGFSFQAVSVHAGTLAFTDAVGVSGRGNTHGIFGATPSTISSAYGVFGVASGSSPWAVYADGKLGASGTKSFRIDHPADPQNKYLLHYSAESPEVINFYSGTIALDAQGEASVQLPSYFASINTDPRYSLTPVGAPMPMLHIAQEIDSAALDAGNRAEPGEAVPLCSFRIAGGVAGAKVSWEVKAVRNDRWVQTNGAPVEQDKPESERGSYQRPELYGAPPEMLPPNRPDHPSKLVNSPQE